MIESPTIRSSTLEAYFHKFRKHIIGQDETFTSPYGEQRILYADWTASGRLYRPIEEEFIRNIYPKVGNTHTETNFTGSTMTYAYNLAKQKIKSHVGANTDDVLLSSGSGMTGMVNKFQRILGLKVHEKYHDLIELEEEKVPVIFVSHMEHHSNQTSWEECLADVVIIPADESGLMDLDALKALLKKYSDRTHKIAAITSCSNVTGIRTPYHEVARLMHKAGGHCFVDFACSAPYIDICMRPPEDPDAHLDAIYFSPHKFLGGPGATGILIFSPDLYNNRIPDNIGGGTVNWTNPWGGKRYYDAIEVREDGGTPAFLQTMRVAKSIALKEEMGVDNILKREEEINKQIFEGLEAIKGLNILAGRVKDRLGVFSFYIDDLHYNLGVKLLNDRFGIQVRGGCSCAGTYGHYLLHVGQDHSKSITCKIDEGDMSEKPGWIRLSIHPTMTDSEVQFIIHALREIAEKHEEWASDYLYDKSSNCFYHKNESKKIETQSIQDWF
ncbi:MAG: aminotransferase class V-fold PLP-dependent enzyme [Saprospiraceae bacterium]|nr:aminotransferase class V-fold PLP-dependent enzyme [Saprospiraceae bacterium]